MVLQGSKPPPFFQLGSSVSAYAVCAVNIAYNRRYYFVLEGAILLTHLLTYCDSVMVICFL